MGHGGVIEELTTDHREVEELFAKVEVQRVGDQQRRKPADELTIELVRHSVAEGMHLYPAVREHGEGLPADHPRFDDLVARLKLEVSEHVRDEEDRLFPMLAAACTPQDLDQLGDRIRAAKMTAPTRPHPSAPDTPPGNKLLGPGAGLVDRARALPTGRGRG
ncbi:hemerythrin domain-containing protein [Streptomyces sp. NPDC058637]|uniref:hemerythrin domain-containing protein n=1 Tax=Streptomyces sp. NPDC058637 TaxID=3346569 RepID=UPI00364EC01E